MLGFSEEGCAPGNVSAVLLVARVSVVAQLVALVARVMVVEHVVARMRVPPGPPGSSEISIRSLPRLTSHHVPRKAPRQQQMVTMTTMAMT